uniref:von Willebrand factor A domain containing 10, tandem duplicate 2 n=1 Tax=Cyprinus carpio TaxID=7962 RepID=A0A8C2GJP5_CYPCA
MVSLVVVAVFLLQGTLFQLPQAEAFKIFPTDDSLTHQQITEAAFLRKMVEVCRDVATSQGNGFTLPDFYSHSNWVELGSTAPFSTLIKPELPLSNIAGPNTKTCRNCVGEDCSDNILPDVLQQKTLTSGYFSLIFSSKPAGKCSHGGFFDRTSSREPTGGINKDDISSYHGFLHFRAAEMAINATMELLEDIRLATGDQAFLRLMGLTQSSVLAFVFDITDSLSQYIEVFKKVCLSIIDSRKGTSEEPSEYVLVPFNGQGSGPLIRTANADTFKEYINSLSASVAGNFSDMFLSELLLTLTRVPPSSDIFVLTDASAKDTELKSSVKAMIESTKSTVNFLLTSSLLPSEEDASLSRSLSLSDIQLYRDLAHVSGGQTIDVTNTTLSQANAVISDAITADLVTVLQVERSSAKAENFSFVLDPSLSNTTVYITGDSLVFTLYSPTGESQSGSVADGPLGSILTVGNLKRVKLNSTSQTGELKISIDSTSSYSLKVTGQSSVNFLFNFVERLEGGDFTPKANRPFTGRNATLFVSVTGGDSVTVTDVLLVEASGSNVVNGTIKALGATDFLVNIDRIPEWPFVVQLKGLLNDSTTRSLPSRFQRQSPTQQQGSRFTITAQPNSTIEPGTPFVLNFTLVTNATGGSYTIRARTDRSFSVSFPSSLNAGTEGSAQGTVTLTAPSNTESGTDVTLTIEAEDPESSDSNYVALRFTVMTTVTDFSSPVCQVVSIKADCPVECSRASWELSTNLTDGNGTGIVGVSLSRGNGSLSLSNVMSADGTNVTVAFYNASCCSQEVELVAVDRVGNVGTCFTSIKSPSTTVSPSGSTTVSPSGSTTVSLNGTTTVSLKGSTTVSLNGSYSVSFSMCVALVGLLLSFLYG